MVLVLISYQINCNKQSHSCSLISPKSLYQLNHQQLSSSSKEYQQTTDCLTWWLELNGYTWLITLLFRQTKNIITISLPYMLSPPNMSELNSPTINFSEFLKINFTILAYKFANVAQKSFSSLFSCCTKDVTDPNCPGGFYEASGCSYCLSFNHLQT